MLNYSGFFYGYNKLIVAKLLYLCKINIHEQKNMS